ncbi:exonuclease SbcCD subunit D [Candidatus Gracilibacteria bacterium]|nr:exonuclease SbcCD subunit D [Candidatus Gracilibacteria bacterium]
MKFLHFSDLHLGMENYSHIDPDTGLSTRFQDWQNSLDAMIELANEHDVDVVLFTGDAFKNRDPSPTYQNAFARAIQRFSDKDRQVVLLVGNHDLPNIEHKAHTLEIYRSLDLPRVTVSKKIEKLQIDTKSGPVEIVTWPWLTRNFLLKNEQYKGKTIEEIDQVLMDKASQLFLSLLDQLTPGIPHLGMVHATIMGATFGSERNVMIGKDLVIPLSLIADTRLDYVACGHLHRHQVLSTAPYVVYAGSPQRIDFGEEKEEKGCLTVSIANSSTEIAFHDLKVRRFITWRIEDQITPPTEDLHDSIVRIVISGDADFVQKITLQDLKEYLVDIYYFAGIERNITKENEGGINSKKASNRIEQSASIEDQLKKYLTIKEIPEPDQQSVIAEAKKIFSSTEVGDSV